MCRDRSVSADAVLLHSADEVGLCQVTRSFGAALHYARTDNWQNLIQPKLWQDGVFTHVPSHNFKETRLNQLLTLDLKLFSFSLKQHSDTIVGCIS